MGELPTWAKVGSLRAWLKIQLAPASTNHYVDTYFDRESIEREKVHMPAFIVVLLGSMRVLGYPLRKMERAGVPRSVAIKLSGHKIHS